MNVLLILLYCTVICSFPHHVSACFENILGSSDSSGDSNVSSVSSQECTNNCSSLGCDMPKCEHDCTCLISGITGQGCRMPKCKYNCLDSSGTGTDMRNCVSGCTCLMGNCDMRSCDGYRSQQQQQQTNNDNDSGNGNGSGNDADGNDGSNGCFCGGSGHDDCGAKIASLELIIGMALSSVFISVGIGIFYVYWKKKRNNINSIETGGMPQSPRRYPSTLA